MTTSDLSHNKPGGEEPGQHPLLSIFHAAVINGIRLLASKGRVRPERDVAISFLSRDEHGSSVIPIAVRDDGSIDRWPPHFFDQAEMDLSQLMKFKMGKRG